MAGRSAKQVGFSHGVFQNPPISRFSEKPHNSVLTARLSANIPTNN